MILLNSANFEEILKINFLLNNLFQRTIIIFTSIPHTHSIQVSSALIRHKIIPINSLRLKEKYCLISFKICLIKTKLKN